MTEIRALLSALGATEAQIESAEQSGTLLALAAERFLLPGDRTLDYTQVASRSGLEPEAMRKLWLALGFPEPSGTQKEFTDTDVDVIRMLLADGTTVSDYLLHEARVISASLARIAEVFIDEMWDQHFSDGQSEQEALAEMAEGIDVDRMEGLLLRLLRRQIVAAIYRRQPLQHAATTGLPSAAVGFADLVGYTSLSQTLSASELTHLVVSFEQATSDLVAQTKGRVVKTIGDEVMFTFDDAPAAADFTLRLVAVAGREFPPVRVGLCWGPVLNRQGDCFGPTVNLASRVVGLAEAGAVLVDSAMASTLSGCGQFSLSPARSHDVKGFGTIDIYRLGTK